MSDPALGLSMLGLIVVVIMLGFPTAFTLMGLGIMFGFVAFYDPAVHFWNNRVFDLMVQRAFGAMTNETLLSIPLFVLMGYVMERGALVPDDIVQMITASGTADEVRAKVDEYVATGCTCPILYPLAPDVHRLIDVFSS